MVSEFLIKILSSDVDPDPHSLYRLDPDPHSNYFITEIYLFILMYISISSSLGQDQEPQCEKKPANPDPHKINVDTNHATELCHGSLRTLTRCRLSPAQPG